MSNTISNRQNWVFERIGGSLDKAELQRSYVLYMLMRTQKMFVYDGLPETIPSEELESLLQVNGFAGITKVNDKLYAFYGGLGGIMNEYYKPTILTVANPYLKFSKTLEIDKDVTVIKNDFYYSGLMPMFNKYSALLSEVDISIRLATINSRLISTISADNDNAKASAEQLLKDVEAGKFVGVIGGKAFLDNVNTQPFNHNSSTNIKDLIELKQYLQATWFNDLGLNSNFNMKREAINESEAGMNESTLLPLIDEMLEERKKGIKALNEMFDLNVQVELSSSWKELRDEMVNQDDEHTKEELAKQDVEPTKEGEKNEIE